MATFATPCKMPELKTQHSLEVFNVYGNCRLFKKKFTINRHDEHRGTPSIINYFCVCITVKKVQARTGVQVHKGNFLQVCDTKTYLGHVPVLAKCESSTRTVQTHVFTTFAILHLCIVCLKLIERTVTSASFLCSACRRRK